MSIYAISDIHGRLKELEHLLEAMEYKPEDTLVFLGDYIDRGPSSKDVIDKLIELSTQHQAIYFLKGNHEDMAIISKVDSNMRKFWMSYGGDKTLDSYPNGIPNDHWNFFYKLNKYYETEDSIFIHATLQENIEMNDQDNETLLWGRLDQPVKHKSKKKIYCGHSSQKSGYPLLIGDARCIYCKGWLTAIETENDIVFQVNNAGRFRKYSIEKYATIVS